MPAYGRLLTGLAAALLAGWISHGPLGRGEAFAAKLEAEAKSVVARSEVPGIEVRIARAPLRRRAVLSGEADEFQREGQGLFPGLNDRVRAVPGIAAIAWEE